MTGSVAAALADFRRNPEAAGWLNLSFFQDGSAEHVAKRVDERVAAGAIVLPPPRDLFNALTMTPLASVKVVILGQDPYPTPGDAHGLAFSYIGTGRLPASLQTILKEMAEETGSVMPRKGDLTAWAKQGVLLLNTALTTEAGSAGAHLKWGWSLLANEAIAAVSAKASHAVFMLWGAPARKRAEFIDERKHLILESGHPSPLNRLRDFQGSKPFSRANEWLERQGLGPIDWTLPNEK